MGRVRESSASAWLTPKMVNARQHLRTHGRVHSNPPANGHRRAATLKCNPRATTARHDRFPRMTLMDLNRPAHEGGQPFESSSQRARATEKAERDSRLVKWSLEGVWARLWRSEMALMMSDVSLFLRFGAAGSLKKPPFLACQGRSDQISRLSAPSDPDTPIGAKNSSAKHGRSLAPARLRVRQRTEDRRLMPGHHPNDWRRRHRRRERTMASRRTFDGHSLPALEPTR